MNIIRQRKRVTTTSYSREFSWRDSPGSGFSFPCTARGKVKLANDGAKSNYAKCVSSEFAVIDNGVRRWDHAYWLDAIGVCDCGQHVTLDSFTNTCDGCGADYNSSGQRLAPREQWGEETGETAADILNIKW